MNKTAFTFDYVCITPDRQIGMNSHPQWELSHVVVGRGERTIGDRHEQFTEGEVILIPPNIPHVWQFDPAYTNGDGCIVNITIFFEDSTLDSMCILFPELKNSIDKIRTTTEAISYSGISLKNIVAILNSMRDKTAENRLPEMLRLLTVLSDTTCSFSVGCNNSLSRIEHRLEKIRIFCACNFARNISLDEISRYIGMNKSAFCTFIKRHTGHTFSEYINECRLRHAVERIQNTDDNIAEIAFSVGFSSVAYFNRLFRSRYGCPPRSLRLRMGTK